MMDKMIVDKESKTVLIILNNEINKEEIKKIVEEILEEKVRNTMRNGFDLIPGINDN